MNAKWHIFLQSMNLFKTFDILSEIKKLNVISSGSKFWKRWEQHEVRSYANVLMIHLSAITLKYRAKEHKI